jgi:hypothetical protein
MGKKRTVKNCLKKYLFIHSTVTYVNFCRLISVIKMDPTGHRTIKKRGVMKAVSKLKPTESKRYSYFSNFKTTKRVRWAQERHYLH